MSQYPSPYYRPEYAYPPGYDPLGPLLVPARRAGLLMIILGALITVYALCNGVSAVVLSAEDLAAGNLLARGQEQVLSPEAMRTAGVVFSIILGIVGITLIVLGALVRQNSGGAILTGLVLCIVLAAIIGLFALLAVIVGMAAPLAFVVACVLALLVVLLGLVVYWLGQAMRAAPQLRAMQEQYQAQYWQYQQNQQAYGQVWQDLPPPPPPPPDQPG